MIGMMCTHANTNSAQVYKIAVQIMFIRQTRTYQIKGCSTHRKLTICTKYLGTNRVQLFVG